MTSSTKFKIGETVRISGVTQINAGQNATGTVTGIQFPYQTVGLLYLVDVGGTTHKIAENRLSEAVN